MNKIVTKRTKAFLNKILFLKENIENSDVKILKKGTQKYTEF